MVAEAAQAVENDAIGPEILDRNDDSALDSKKDLTNELPADSATETPTTNQLGKSPDSTKQADSTESDSDKLAASQNESSSNVRSAESASNGVAGNQENTAATTPGGIAGEAGPSTNTEMTIAETSDPANLQVAGDPGLKTGQVVQSGNAELAAQSQRQVDQAATAGTTPTTESDDGSNRTSRNGRGRNIGNTPQKARPGQSESPTAKRDQAAASSSEAVAGKTGQIDLALANETTDGTANPESVATPITPTAVQTPLADAGIAAGQAVGTNTPDTGYRSVAVGPSSGEFASIGPSSSDNSGRNGDQLSSRNAENLSRTDIADRARLIHRISKAFTKMGVDGGQIRMKMHPETLGGVLLEMRVRGKNVEATVTADNEAARGLLQQQLSELRQRLESQGMTVQRLEVALRDDTATSGALSNDPRGEMSGGDRHSDGYGQSHYSSGSGNSRNNRASATLNAAATLPKAGVMTLPRSPAAPGTLDLRL